MRQISHWALALSLSVAAMAVHAQEQTINKGDLPDPRTSIDQNPVSVGEVPVSGAAVLRGRQRIVSQGGEGGGLLRAANGSREVLQQQAVVGGGQRDDGPSEFQKFVQESTGKSLPLFGAEFFDQAPTTFAPVSNSPVPADYPLGPGDEVLVRGWGTVDIDYRATIDRNGLINIPTVGAIVLGGVRAGEAQEVIRGAVGRLFKGVSINVTYGQLRAITVYVVGQASRPGTYTVASTSSLITALFASGGPGPGGSMRQVQVKRAGKTVAELDLYAFLGKGDKSADIRLLDGDTIVIPPATGFVAVVGKVNKPAIYELRSAQDTVQTVLEHAGGLPVVADPRRAFLERIDPSKARPRSVEEFELNARGLATRLKSGDILNITSITPEFANAVTLRGNVDQSIRAPFRPGMRVSDLIPSRDYLMSRNSIQRQNNALSTGSNENEAQQGSALAANIGNLVDEINWDYAVIERVNRADLTVSVVPFNLGQVFAARGSADDPVLQAGDTVTVFSQKDVAVPMEKRRVFVRIEGEVKVPGVYQMSPAENLHHLLAKAGGPTSSAYLFGVAFYRDQARREQEENLRKVTARLESQLRIERSKAAANQSTALDGALQEARRQVAFDAARGNIEQIRNLKPTGRIAFGLDPRERSFNRLPQLKLENGDRLVVPPRPDFVHVFGAVTSEASAIWKPGMRVAEYLRSAGLTADADEDNVFIIRVDGTVLANDRSRWLRGDVSRAEVMPGDAIVVPERTDRETAWTRFTGGMKEWAQIFASFGLGAAAVKTLR